MWRRYGRAMTGGSTPNFPKFWISEARSERLSPLQTLNHRSGEILNLASPQLCGEASGGVRYDEWCQWDTKPKQICRMTAIDV